MSDDHEEAKVADAELLLSARTADEGGDDLSLTGEKMSDSNQVAVVVDEERANSEDMRTKDCYNDTLTPDNHDARSSSCTRTCSSTWLIDRTKGASKLGESRPPLPCCWVPPPVGWCPRLLEQNCLCEWYGTVGVIHSDNHLWRKRLMGIGLTSTVVSMVLTIVACFAISNDFDILKSTSFTRGSLTTSTNFLNVTLHVGLRAVAIKNSNIGENVVTFDQFCALDTNQATNATQAIKTKYLNMYLDPDECGACDDVSTGLVTSVIISLATCLPTLFTDVTRMYHNYDVNCQKVFATFISFVSAMLSLNTLVLYQKSCFRAFFDGDVPFDSQYNVMSTKNAAQAFAHGLFEWTAGPGFLCLAVATVLKFVDIICHFLVPTPDITRSKDEQFNYNKIDND
jgi:hypothetical protein